MRAKIEHGKFITFEGGEGVGKTTQVNKLYENLVKNKIKTIKTREPGGCDSAEEIRKLILDSNFNLTPDTQVLLHYAARYQHLQQTILPALKMGITVICDRYIDSTRAYQFNLDANASLISFLEETVNLPDVTFILDSDVSSNFKRIINRNSKDYYERLSEQFHENVRTEFRNIADRNERCILIDSSKSEQEISETIFKTYKQLFVD